MEAHMDAIVKSLVAMAWADGHIKDEEERVLEALIAAFELDEPDAEAVRAYASAPRTLDDVPLTELSADDRRLLLQHAVIISYVDGEQSEQERAVLDALVGRLHIPASEADPIIAAADRRAKRLLTLL